MFTSTMVRLLGVLDTATDLSSSVLARIAGVPPASLSEALRDCRYLGSEKEAHLLFVAQRCSEILDALRPLAVVKGNWQTLNALYESGKSAEEIRATIIGLFEKTI